MSELRDKTVKGVAWSAVDRFASQGIGFVFSIILARMLMPEDYGTVAITLIFIALIQVFVDSGFSNALIRKADRTEQDLSTAFYFNIGVGGACFLLMFALAPLIALFFDQPVLTDLIRVCSISIIFNSLCIVQQSLFSIKIDFRTQAVISLTAVVISGITGISLAFNGWGVWSLATQNVSYAFLRMTGLWLTSKWRPCKRWSSASFRYLFGYGSKLLASGLISTGFNNLYPLVIGKLFPPAELGLYSRAQGYAEIPSANVTSVIQRVTFPVLSQMQDDEERLRANYRRLLKTTAFVVFPLMMGLAAIASPLINWMLTPKWNGCVVYLQILCFAMMLYPIHAINLNLLQVKGRSDLFLKLEIIKRVLGVVLLIVAFPFGVIGLCWSLVVNSVICLVINTHYTGQFIGMGIIRQLKDLLPVLFLSAAMAILAYCATLISDNFSISALIGLAFGITVFILGAKLLHYNELWEVWKFFRSIL